ncbi:MAG TPA: beta-eliminating lyase-related protein [Vicinamibacteria bacterium]|nr:beta-eliminating lyase-related protein [Vicinamibacteria bacterium]
MDFTGDGIPLTPPDFAALLARLTKGDAEDDYSRGGAVATLEAQFARLLGKEAAVFMPTGTLANHLAVRALCGPKRRVVVQETSHFYNDSGDCAQQLSQLNLIPLQPGRATFSREDVERVLERAATSRVATAVGAIAIESPVRRQRGEVFDFEAMRQVSALARERGIGLHLDGARLFVAAAYSGRPLADYTALFDTVYVSLWKCFNSGSGAILAGPKALLADMYQVRRMFGGALWNAWPFAVVAAHYAEGYLERLTAAVRNTETLLTALASLPGLEVVRVPNGTSVSRVNLPGGNPARFRERLRADGISLPEPDGSGFWLRVNETAGRRPATELVAAFRAAAAP